MDLRTSETLTACRWDCRPLGITGWSAPACCYRPVR